MARYTHIEGVSFDGIPLPLPLSVSVSRSARPRPGGSDHQVFATSIEIDRPTIRAEVCTRATATAEGLAIGRQGDLSFTVAAASDAAPARGVTLSGAVLVAVEISYRQTAMATATLRFVAQSASGLQEPFNAEDVA